MNSIKFPDMFSGANTNLVEDYDATLQNLKLLLLSEEGTLFGDPQFGLNLRHNLFEQKDVKIWDDLLKDRIYEAVSVFMPQIYITRKGISVSRSTAGKLEVSISAMNRLNFKTNMYNIVLLENK